MENELLTDRTERDRAVATPPESIWLSAGAGAGKTEVLVTRIANMIASGIDPASIVAITFTEKAAGELKKRIIDRLHNLIHHQTDGKLSITPAQLRAARRLFAGTIHSFALRLLQQAPLEAQFDSELRVLDDRELAVRLRDFTKQWRSNPIVTDLYINAIAEDAISRSHCDNLVEIAVELDRIEFDSSPTEVEIHNAQIEVERLTKVITTQSALCNRTDDKLAIAIQNGVTGYSSLTGNDSTGIQFLANVQEWISTFAVNSSSGQATGNRLGNAAAWGSREVITQTRQCFAEWTASALRWRDLIAAQEAAQWGQPLQELNQGFRDNLLKSGETRFDDLIEAAIGLFTPGMNPNPLYSKYRHLHLDEAQDSDPRQVVLWKAVSGYSSGNNRSLFVVGDTNQSIYGFRNADVSLFRETLHAQLSEINPKAETRLTANFRSTPPLIGFFNRLFPTIFGDDKVRMDAASNHPGELPAVVLLTSKNDEKLTAENALQYSAESVAAYIAGCRERNELPESPDGTAWQKIAVLMPASTSAAAYEAAFRKYRIPYINEMSRGFFTDDIIGDTISCLGVISDPTDGVALLGALRGCYFAVPDEQLWWWQNQLTGAPQNAADQNKLRLQLPPEGAPEALHFALTTLTALVKFAETEPAVMIAKRLFESSGIYLASWRDSGPANRAKLNGVLTLLRRLPSDMSLKTAVELLRNGRNENMRDLTVAIPDEPAVRMMSVHGAKGLEFEWVIVHGTAFWGDSGDKKSPLLLRHPETGKTQLRFENWYKTANYDEALLLLREREREERRRLFYVACTRAVSRLILPVFQRSHSSGGLDFSTDVRNACIESDTLIIHCEELLLPQSPHVVPMPDVSILSPAACVNESPLPIQSVTTITHQEESFPAKSKSDTDYAQKFGTFIHRALARTPFDANSSAIHRICEFLFNDQFSEYPEDWIKQANDMIDKWLHSSLARRISIGTIEKEYPILYRREKDIISGTVDVLARLENEWIVVDYKSDTGVTIDILRERYAEQVKLYCECIAQMINEKVHGYIWSLPLALEIGVV